ncbi:MAG: magnesium transporter [candidate division Zixibacteria bacterium]|nr:magnesium transporter [candidate division Zixibacteria bacterium]
MSDIPISPDDVLEEGDFQRRRSDLLDTTRELLAENDLPALRLILNNQHPSDLADLLGQFSEEDQPRLFELLATTLGASTLSELDAPALHSLFEHLDDRTISRYVERMEPDDAADLLGELSEERRTGVIAFLAEQTTETVEELLPHAEDTGGGIMTSRLVALREDMTVEDAVNHIREWGHGDEVFYLYVVSENHRLVGTVPLKRFVVASPGTKIRQITKPDPLSVRPDMDQEEVAHIFADYNLLALPVVDDQGVLIGQITVDDIVDVIKEEATEDFYEMAAISSEEMEERSAFGVVKRRLPWLLVCLGGTFLSGAVIDLFSDSLSKLQGMVLFLPGIMAMGGNSGVQTSTVTIRNITLGSSVAFGNILRGILRELRIASTMGILLGLLVAGVARLWTGDTVIGGCVGLAMCSAIVVAAALGALIPVVFYRFDIDPAVASGPLITTMNDALSLIIYFGVSIVLLHFFRPGFL